MSKPVPIVVRLQEMASDKDTPVPDLLRKALMIATKLGLEEFRAWVLHELNGYRDIKDIPEYRKIRGDLRAQNPYHGLIPFIIPDSATAEMVSSKPVFESIESLCHLATTDSKGVLTYTFAPELEAMLMKIQGGYPLRPLLVVGHNQIAAIVEKVRTHLLDWALRLEADGILGDGLTFSEGERERAKLSQNINIQNFQGVLGDVSGGEINQRNELTITTGDFSSLSKYLERCGVGTEDLAALKTAVSESPTPTSTSSFSASVSKWIGKMISKAADGSWEIGVAVAADLLSRALAKYYGIG